MIERYDIDVLRELAQEEYSIVRTLQMSMMNCLSHLDDNDVSTWQFRLNRVEEDLNRSMAYIRDIGVIIANDGFSMSHVYINNVHYNCLLNKEKTRK